MSVAIFLYRALTWVGLPVLELMLHRRVARGREDPTRLQERRGIASRPRPSGELIWIHAASVGEANSCLRVVELLLQGNDDRTVLLTTGTVTSAKMVETRLPERAIHQYYPVDRGPWVSRFLDHWLPDAAVWVESELWPNMISQAARRGTPLALINARISQKSERNWRFGGNAIRQLLSCFSVCLAQTPKDVERFKRLGALNAIYVGNLKYSAMPLAAKPEDVAMMIGAVGRRPVWLAASTHPGDEDLAIDVHRKLVKDHPDVLTMIALRHPNRLDEVVQRNAKAGFQIACRSLDTVPKADTSIFIIDTVGEMGLFYQYNSVVLVCGTFSDRGGHNPIEPAMLDCAILHGPDMRNFETVTTDLEAAQAARTVLNSDDTAHAVSALLSDPEQIRAMAHAARTVADENADVIERVMERITAMIMERRSCATP